MSAAETVFGFDDLRGAPGESLRNIRPARRQAYRYGRQLRLLTNLNLINSINSAWLDFLRQFDDPITVDYLISAYHRGVDGDSEPID